MSQHTFNHFKYDFFIPSKSAPVQHKYCWIMMMTH